MSDGTVKSFCTARGYGVIAPDDGSEPISIRLSMDRDVQLDGLKAGQRVSYERVKGLFGNFYAKNLMLRP